MSFLSHRLSPFSRRTVRRVAGCAALLGAALSVPVAKAAPSILIDAASGDVLEQHEATRSWFPASTTKLMTVYVALEAVRAGRISLNTPMIVSPRAARMAPSKMGFVPGTQVTLDNALKMLMVKSANDVAVTIAEGISGSVEAFAGEMNQAAAALGMRESRFYNPNGLPDPRHVSSARDLAILGRALILRFPDHADLFDIGAMRLGGQIIATHNGLLGRYPGADGMKTGYTCAAGFNVVASATRGGRRLIAVVLGAPGARLRDMKAVSMFNHGFAGQVSNYGSVTSFQSAGVTDAFDARTCRNRAKAQKEYLATIEDAPVALASDSSQSLINQPERALFAFGGMSTIPQNLSPAAVVATPRPAFAPIDVFVGPVAGWTGQVAHADDYAGPPATTATAYAADKGVDAPLKPSEDALPMKRGKTKVAKVRHRARANVAEAAKPDADDKPAKTVTVKQAKGKAAAAHAKPASPKATAKVPARTTGARAPKTSANTPAKPQVTAKVVAQKPAASGKTAKRTPAE